MVAIKMQRCFKLLFSGVGQGGRGISSLRPCYPGRTILVPLSGNIRRLNVPLTVRWLLEVDIGVSKGTPGDHVPTDPDREDGSGWAEFLVQHGLGDVRMQIPDVQGSHGVAGSAGVHRSLA